MWFIGVYSFFSAVLDSYLRGVKCPFKGTLVVVKPERFGALFARFNELDSIDDESIVA